MLAIVDEYTRERLAIDVARRLNSQDVLARLTELCVVRGMAEHIRSDNGPEFAATALCHSPVGLPTKCEEAYKELDLTYSRRRFSRGCCHTRYSRRPAVSCHRRHRPRPVS